MKLNKYIRSRGLIPAYVASKMGVSRQMIEQYGRVFRNGQIRLPTLRTAERISKAMTEMGAETSIADITTALLRDDKDVKE